MLDWIRPTRSVETKDAQQGTKADTLIMFNDTFLKLLSSVFAVTCDDSSTPIFFNVCVCGVCVCVCVCVCVRESERECVSE